MPNISILDMRLKIINLKLHPHLPAANEKIPWTCLQITATQYRWSRMNTWMQRQYGHHFADDTLKHIFSYENIRISIKISLKFVHKGPINNCPPLVQMMAWHRPGDKPLSEPSFSNSFPCKKIVFFQLKFHYNLFPRVQLTISQCWFRHWLGIEEETSHYLKQ